MSWRAEALVLLALVAVGCKQHEPAAAVGSGTSRPSAATRPWRAPGPPPGSALRPARLAGPALRPARLAGAWYPKEPAALRAQLDGLLTAAAKAGEEGPPGTLLGLVAPHAGLRYSGRTAAAAYRLVQAAKPNRVFVLGPSHYLALRGVAVVDGLRFDTPLGALRIDTVARTKLLSHPLFLRLPAADAREHSVELQMPFLRRVAPQAHVVPLIVGQLTLHEVRRVADAIRALLVPGDLVVASSDFTHYGPQYGYVPFSGADKSIAVALERLDRRAFTQLEGGALPAFWRFKHETADTICGFYPISILRAILGPTVRGKLLRYDTSGGILGDFKNSVSYLAIAFAGAGWAAARAEPTLEFLSRDEARRAVQIARRALQTHFGVPSGTKARPFDAKAAGLVVPGRLEQRHGVFVTLKRPDGSLRGCIGHVIGRLPLHEGIVANALNAALYDTRFAPVRAAELPRLALEVTVLTPPRAVGGAAAITIGQDGMILRQGDKSALFLPQVAVEQGWGLERTLRALARKAGLEPEAWRKAGYEVFQGYVYEEHGRSP